jgi:peptide/nickel transport system substrate-binding protein
MLKRIGMLVLSLAILLGITACSGNTQTNSSAAPTAKAAKNVINIAVGNDPGTLDPCGTSGNPAWDQVSYQIYDTLYTLDNNNKEVPRLAESWEKKDELTYVFRLRKGVKFSDGSPFKASDVIFSFNVYKSNQVGALQVAAIDFDKTKAIDDNTLQIVYKQPSAPAFPQLAYIRITSESAYNASKDKMKTTPVGTGAYMLKEWVTGTTITLVANPNYWGDKPVIQTAVYKIITDAAQRTNALLANNVDLAFTIKPSDVVTIKNDKNFVVNSYSNSSNDSMIFNTSADSICKNVDLRKAIAYATDKAGIQKVVYAGIGNTATAPVPAFFRDFDKAWMTNGYYDYNMDKAKEALQKSGVPAGTALTLITNGQAEQVGAAQVIQASLQKLGLNLKIVTYDASVYTSNARNPKGGWDIGLFSTSSPNLLIPDMFNAYFLNLGIGSFKPDDFVKAVQNALLVTDVSKMGPTSKQVVDIVMRDLPHFSFMETPQVAAYSNTLQGYAVWYVRIVPIRLLSFK